MTPGELDHPPAHTRIARFGESSLASSQGKSRNSDFLTENENIYKGQGAWSSYLLQCSVISLTTGLPTR
jgi:hypothetical protein